MEKSLRRRGHEIIGVSTLSEADRLIHERKIDLVLLDIRLPDGSGLDFLVKVRDLDEEILVIVITAFPEVKTAVRAMKEGARDFIVKPFELEELHLSVERALESRKLRHDVRRLEREHRARDKITEILGESPAIERLREEARLVAEADTPVLLVGETGTGKELVADSIHRLSSRSNGPLIKVNCSAFSEQTLESELFGQEKGAFTDAEEARAGLFEMADGGSLLLDEVSEMKAGLQAKLPRIVEGQPFRRVGGRREIQTNVRVIATTNRDLRACIRSGSFRQDLYYRLNAFQITVPPLRARGSDVVLLARFFLQRSAAALRKGPLTLTPQAEEVLLSYDWPGNVRELRNVMERAAILSEAGAISIEQLPGDFQMTAFVRRHAAKGSGAMPSLVEMERRYMEYIVEQVNGNLSEACRVLGVARNTLKARLRSPG
jgi:DNA-binding NtrC family response regulator